MGKTVRLHKKVAHHYKYAINDNIGKLPRTMKMTEVISHLSKNGITRDEFYRDRDIPFDSDKSIPADRLQKYAIVFDTTIEELQNHEVKATSLRTEFLKSAKIKSSLK